MKLVTNHYLAVSASTDRTHFGRNIKNPRCVLNKQASVADYVLSMFTCYAACCTFGPLSFLGPRFFYLYHEVLLPCDHFQNPEYRFQICMFFRLNFNCYITLRHVSAIHGLTYCPACRTSSIATRFWVVVICPIIKCLIVLEFSFILFDLCLFTTIFNFILNYVPIVPFWIFTYHKIRILLIIFCFIWNYWIFIF